MAWRCSASGNADLVRNLRKAGVIHTDHVEQAMVKVDRSNYAPQNPYTDAPQPLGHQATISAPHMHAHALELLRNHLQPGMRALDVGCGSGYLAAVMARMVGIEGQVVAIDYLAPLVALSLENLRKEDADLLESFSIKQLLRAAEEWVHVGTLRHGGNKLIMFVSWVNRYVNENISYMKAPDVGLIRVCVSARSFVP
eukprot:Skav200828  [mRNA]  locus=scaffold3034:90460:91785:+ [translate_table: standard]